MQGRRLPDYKDNDTFPNNAQPGDYWKDAQTGIWWCYLPKGGIGSLADHQITEHEDGTITVNPSILMEGHWHGYLERGVWREV